MLFVGLARALAYVEGRRVRGQAILCVDEGEMFMHPRWQRKYITSVVEFICKFPEIASKLHLLVSSHSLIVAADTPSFRLFDVDRGNLVNSFGLNPKQVLSQIFHVESFSGERSAKEIARLTEFLKNPRSAAASDARTVAAKIADLDLRDYMEQELIRRVQSRV
jgi:predicted ATP-binding protein involved in virulence